MKKLLPLVLVMVLCGGLYSAPVHNGTPALAINSSFGLENLEKDENGNLKVTSSTNSINNYTNSYATYTVTADTLADLDGAIALVSIIVSSATPASSLQVYDSKASATNQIANIDLGTVGNYQYDLELSSGLTYTITIAPESGVTIIYKK